MLLGLRSRVFQVLVEKSKLVGDDTLER